MEGEDEIMEGTILLRGVLALRACWTTWARGPAQPGGDPTPLQPPSGAVANTPFLQGYREHLAYCVNACLFCLQCGQLPRDNRLGFSLLRDGTCRGTGGIISGMVAVALAPLAAVELVMAIHSGRGFLRKRD